MSKKLVEIGDVFGSWTVIGLEENDRKYNYNYICKCDCGHKRMIRKDKLVSFTFPKCDHCLSNGLIERKWDIIKTRWDSMINGTLVQSRLNLNKKYAWKCPEGHTYYENIIALKEKCPKCETLKNEQIIRDTIVKNYNVLIDYLDAVCSEVFEDVEIIIDENLLTIQVNIGDFVIFFSSGLHKHYSDILHGSKQRYYELSQGFGRLKKGLQSLDKEVILLEIDFLSLDLKKILPILSLVKSKQV